MNHLSEKWKKLDTVVTRHSDITYINTTYTDKSAV